MGQRLEHTLAEAVGYPCAKVSLQNGEVVTLHSIRALEEVLQFADNEIRDAVKAEFAAHQARWDAACIGAGHASIVQARRKSNDQVEDLLEALSSTPATSLAGVAAKLHAAILEGEDCEDENEFPWPQIRSAFEDVIRIGLELVPEQMFPDELLQPRPAKSRRGQTFRSLGENNGDAA